MLILAVNILAVKFDLVRKAARFTARKLTLLRMELATEVTESVKAVQK